MDEIQAYELVRTLNRARKALGQFIDESNDFAINADFNEFMAMGRQFQELTTDEFRKAIENAFFKKREIQSQAGVEPSKVVLNPVDVKGQCHTIIRAKRIAEQEAMPQLTEGKAESLPEDDTFFTDYFPKMWQNYKTYGKSCLTPIWSTVIFPNQWHIKQVSERLRLDREFDEPMKANARRMVSNMVVEELMVAQKAAGVSDWVTLYQPGEDYNDLTARKTLQERIDRHNATKPTRIDFNVAESHDRVRKIATLLSYGYIYDLKLKKQPK